MGVHVCRSVSIGVSAVVWFAPGCVGVAWCVRGEWNWHCCHVVVNVLGHVMPVCWYVLCVCVLAVLSCVLSELWRSCWCGWCVGCVMCVVMWCRVSLCHYCVRVGCLISVGVWCEQVHCGIYVWWVQWVCSMGVLVCAVGSS